MASPSPSPQPAQPPFVLAIDGCPASQVFSALRLDSGADSSQVARTLESTLPALLEWSKALFIQHDRALAASELLQAILRSVQPHRSTDSAQPSWIAELDDRLGEYPFTLISKVDVELRELQRICGGPIDSSWTVVNDGSDVSGIATWYRSEPDGGLHSFLVSGEVQAPLFNCLAMIKEAELFHLWLPAVKHTKMTPLDDSRYRMQLYVLLAAVWPMADRDAILYGYGDVVDHAIGVYFRSQSPDEVLPAASPAGEDVIVTPCDPAVVRMDIRNGGFWFESLPSASGCASPRTLVRGIFHVDPKLPIIPYWFINTVAGQFCGTIINMMRARAPALFEPINGQPSPYKIRMETQTRVYDEINKRLAEADQVKKTSEERKPAAPA